MTDVLIADESFAIIVEHAIRRSLTNLSEQHAGETLAGYAVCTDDCLMTIFWVATTREHMNAVADESLRYSAVEWPYGHQSDAFDEAQLELARRYEASDGEAEFSKHVVGSFWAIVEALKRVQSSGGLGENVLVYALSTDPSEFLESLERRGVEYLNSADGQAKWHSAHGGL